MTLSSRPSISVSLGIKTCLLLVLCMGCLIKDLFICILCAWVKCAFVYQMNVVPVKSKIHLELAFQIVVSYQVDAGNWTLALRSCPVSCLCSPYEKLFFLSFFFFACIAFFLGWIENNILTSKVSTWKMSLLLCSRTATVVLHLHRYCSDL